MDILDSSEVKSTRVSVVIPTLNEEDVIVMTLARIRGQRGNELDSGIEVIVSDGGSSDRTVELAGGLARVINSTRDRGIQMNRGVKEASGDILLFLHADTMLSEGWKDKIVSVMSDNRVVGGAFSLSIDSERVSYKIISATANIRSRITGIPYGDQGIFVKRSAFEEIGGFGNMPIMEDVDLVRRLKKVGKIVMLRDKVKTSARRWEKEGVVYTTLRNWLLVSLYYMGVSPERFYRFYKMIR